MINLISEMNDFRFQILIYEKKIRTDMKKFRTSASVESPTDYIKKIHLIKNIRSHNHLSLDYVYMNIRGGLLIYLHLDLLTCNTLINYNLLTAKLFYI